jgi:hypothetical protein
LGEVGLFPLEGRMRQPLPLLRERPHDSSEVASHPPKTKRLMSLSLMRTIVDPTTSVGFPACTARLSAYRGGAARPCRLGCHA